MVLVVWERVCIRHWVPSPSLRTRGKNQAVRRCRAAMKGPLGSYLFTASDPCLGKPGGGPLAALAGGWRRAARYDARLVRRPSESACGFCLDDGVTGIVELRRRYQYPILTTPSWCRAGSVRPEKLSVPTRNADGLVAVLSLQHMCDQALFVRDEFVPRTAPEENCA